MDQILLEDAHTKEEFRLSVDRWFSKEKDDGEVFRELPVLTINQEPLPGYPEKNIIREPLKKVCFFTLCF